HCHRAFTVRQRGAIGPIKLPGPTELGSAKLRLDAPQLLGGRVVVGNASRRVRHVNGSRQCSKQFTGFPLAFLQPSFRELALADVARNTEQSRWTAVATADHCSFNLNPALLVSVRKLVSRDRDEAILGLVAAAGSSRIDKKSVHVPEVFRMYERSCLCKS